MPGTGFAQEIDSDGDGLSDDREVVYMTDINNPDTDNDGLLDGAEVDVHDTIPTLVDSDGDGLSDSREVNDALTNPRDPDTDKDGLNDGDEVDQFGTDPLVADTDGDGIEDDCDICPNSASNLDLDNDGNCDSEACKDDLTDFESDFGIWKTIPTASLSCPLDVHSGNVARKLKLLKRKQNDAKALLELDTSLRKLDPIDPVKYDFALFGLGVFEKFWVLEML